MTDVPCWYSFIVVPVAFVNIMSCPVPIVALLFLPSLLEFVNGGLTFYIRQLMIFLSVKLRWLQQNSKRFPKSKWKAQSKNDPLIFRPFLKVFRSTSEHFQKWPKNQGIVLALSLSNVNLLVKAFYTNK